MKHRWYRLLAGNLREQSGPVDWPTGATDTGGERWVDIESAEPEELRQFLAPLDLHPLQMARCLDALIEPGMVTFGKSILIEYPAAFEQEAAEPAYLTILLQTPVLVTVRRGAIPALDRLIGELTSASPEPLQHLPQIIYLILDAFADLNVAAQIQIRDRIMRLSRTLSENPAAVSSGELARLRRQVGNLVSLIENQLYSVSGLSTSDDEALQEPHRKAYLEDLIAEAEIAQRSVYRLESRVNELVNDYQMAGNDRVEYRLRVLTIVSAITLPLGLITGLLGMNVGGMPGATAPAGFLIVVAIMAVVAVVQFWFFRRSGWFK